MNEQFLELELRLMIVRHGRSRVLSVLARLGEQSVEELERDIAALAERKAAGKKPQKGRPAADLIEEATRDCPGNKALVTTLVVRFENRSFLPQLRDVMRFLERVGVPHGKLRSRAAGLPKVVAALAQRPEAELRQLAASSPSDSDSDFLMLAREIMAGGRPPRPQKPGAD